MAGDVRKRIAVISTNMDVEYAADIQAGITDEARERGYDVYIFNANVSNEVNLKHNAGQYNIYSLINYSLFDGVIVYSNLIQGRKIYDVLEKRLSNLGIPVVGVDAPIGHHYYVGVENYRAMKAIVEHFIVKHGFTKIDYISGPEKNTDSQIRLAAYCDALIDHGISVEQRRISKGSFDIFHGREAAEKLLKSGREFPEAIVCANDQIAIGVSNVLKERGIKIPEQICVSGFDNMFEARNYLPRITTVDRSLSNVGKAAVKIIDEAGRGLKPSESELFSAKPIFSESCGCSSCEKADTVGLRKKYFKMVDYFEKNLSENNVMMEELNDAKSYEDFIRILKPHVKAIEASRFYLCLDKGLADSLKADIDAESQPKSLPKTNGYARTMAVAIAYENGEYNDYTEFPSSWMLPWNPRKVNDKETHVYVFSPVHFQDICFGYCIVENSDYVIQSMLYRAWQSNLSNELENLRKQMNLQKMFDKLDRLYVVDSLTGIYNRFGFAKYTNALYEDAVKNGTSSAIFFSDLDSLKFINDKYGHDKGDLAIKTLAYALKRAAAEGTVCARFGGDEFVAFIPGCDEDGAKNFCKRFEKEVDHYNRVLDQEFKIESSYGVEVFVPGENETISEYIEKADDKMYHNKVAKKKYNQ
ncbi:MAG: GGDEF domain-containing protein [Acetatifactor sp.]|nr:GGDEF domain-containing protein [Acetatifactor sp.]